MTDKRKRAAPTIDLTATDVSSAADESETTPPPEPTPPESAAQPEPAPSESVAHPEPPAGKAPQAAEQTTEHHEPAPRRGGFGAAIAAGLAGGIVATGVLAAVWYLGLLPAVPVTSNDGSAQIAALQKQVQELQSRPAPATDNQAVDALRQRLSKIESDIAKVPPGDAAVSKKLTAADSAMKSLGVALAALTKRSDDIAAKANQAEQSAAAAEKAVSELRDSVKNAASQASSAVDPAQLAEVQKRIGALAQSVETVRAQIGKTSATDTAARLALSAAALRDAVESGAPYQTELAQVKSLGADESTLAPLDTFAADGLPGKAALTQELRALIPTLMKASGSKAASGGFLERLQANARKLVRIRPTDAPAGDDPSAVLARLEAAAAKADIDGALAAIGKLPATARQQAADWVTKVVARQKALAAARQFASDAARGLPQ